MKKIIITGGATRIGAAIARKLSGPKKEILIHYNKSKSKAENLKKHLKSLNKKMKESATNLEFEEAAKIRDEIRKLEASELEIVLNPKENITISAPEKGENITKNEYTSNIRKKMVEMRNNRMGRRSR